MTRNDIDRLFTEQVTGLLAQGYQINPGSMNGSEGEIAHVDLRKGSEIIRVLLEHQRNWEKVFIDVYCIRVGRNTEPVHDYWRCVIWNHRLETISEIKLAKISDTFFTTPEEGTAMAEKRMARWKAKGTIHREFGDAYKSVALRWLRRQPRMGRCKPEDIESLTKREDGGRVSFQIKAKGKVYLLSTRKA